MGAGECATVAAAHTPITQLCLLQQFNLHVEPGSCGQRYWVHKIYPPLPYEESDHGSTSREREREREDLR